MSLKAEEIEWIERSLGKTKTVTASGIAQLFLASPAPSELEEYFENEAAFGFRSRASSGQSTRSRAGSGTSIVEQFPDLANGKGWVFSRVAGATLLVEDKEIGTFVFMIFDLIDRILRFQFEVYEGMEFTRMNDTFYCFEIEQCVAGFNFSDMNVASLFGEKVSQVFACYTGTSEQMKSRSSKRQDEGDGVDHEEEKATEKRGYGFPFFGIGSGTHSAAGDAKAPAKGRRRKRDYILSKITGKGRAGSKSEDNRSEKKEKPSVGSLDISDIPHGWKEIFRKAGIRKRDLQDPNMSHVIQDVLASYGLEMRQRTVTRTYEKRLGQSDDKPCGVSHVSYPVHNVPILDHATISGRPLSELPVVRIRFESDDSHSQAPPPPPSPPPSEKKQAHTMRAMDRIRHQKAKEYIKRRSLDNSPSPVAKQAKQVNNPTCQVMEDAQNNKVMQEVHSNSGSETVHTESTRESNAAKTKTSGPDFLAEIRAGNFKMRHLTPLEKAVEKSSSTISTSNTAAARSEGSPKLGFLGDISSGNFHLKQTKAQVQKNNSLPSQLSPGGTSNTAPSVQANNPASVLDAIKTGNFSLKKVDRSDAPPEKKPVSGRPAFLDDIKNGVVRLRAVSRIQTLPELDKVGENDQMSLLAQLRHHIVQLREKVSGEDQDEEKGSDDSDYDDDDWSDQE